jgi:hypothetical protein
VQAQGSGGVVQPVYGEADACGPAGNVPPSSYSDEYRERPDVGGAALEPSPQAVALDLEKALIDSGVDADEARAMAADFIERSTVAQSPPEASSEADVGGAALEPSPQAVALDLEKALIDSGVDADEARAMAADFIERSTVAQSPPEASSEADVGGAALEPSPQAVALDLEKALIDSGVDADEARAMAADFIERSTVAQSPPEASSEADVGGAALEPSPQAVALDLEKALIDSGVDADEARAMANDFVEHEALPPAPGDDDASSAAPGN